MKKVIYLFAAALLVGCSTDELSNNGGAIAPPSGEAASSGTVKFTNNTSMTIGSGSAMSRAAFLTRGAAFDVDGNAACQLDIEQVEENRDGASIVAETRYESDGVTIADIKDISGKDVIIEEGVVSRIGELNFQYARTLNKTVFVHGTFDVNNIKSHGNGRIVVYPGGVLNYNMDAVDNLTIICYEGATVNFAGDVDITADGKVKVGGDLDLGEGTIGVEGQLYVGGNLTCKNISSSTDDAQIHVIGNLTANAKLNEEKAAIQLQADRETIRGNILRAVSHDLRTPLTAISGAASVLLSSEEIASSERSASLVRDIKSDADALSAMVENLLSITKIRDGVMPLNKQEEMLEEVAGDALLTMRRRFPDCPIALELSDDILYLPMEPMLIKQVIVNLLENAIRHSGDREHIRLRLFRQEDWAVVEVRDRGRGISPEVSQAVQLGRPLEDNLSGDSSRGMGIGLSVCQSIIKAHDGFFAAGNDPEGGAVFRFGLPMEEIKDE